MQDNKPKKKTIWSVIMKNIDNYDKRWTVGLAFLSVIFSFIAIIVSFAIGYLQYFNNKEKLDIVLYSFSPFQPSGNQVSSIDVGFINNGNRNCVISEVAFCVPFKDGGNINYLGIDRDDNKVIESLLVQPNDIKKKKIYFFHNCAFVDSAGYMNREMGFIKIHLKFSGIDSKGNKYVKSIDNIFITVKDNKIVASSMPGDEIRISLLKK